MAGLIDVDAELARLDKEIDKLATDTDKLTMKLGNEKFVSKAPPEVVAKERQKLAELESSLGQLNQKRLAIADMA